MATSRVKIEHLEHYWEGDNNNKPWKKLSHSRRWLKKQMNKFIRRSNKNIKDDDIGGKQGRKPCRGWEY